MHLDRELKSDCQIWVKFLEMHDTYVGNRPMVDLVDAKPVDVSFYSDASAATDKGFGCILSNRWISGDWELEFVKSHQPSIEYLELFGYVWVFFLGRRNWHKKGSWSTVIIRL